MIGGLDLSTARIGYAAPSGELCSISGHAGASDPYRRLHELRRELERVIVTHPPIPRVMVVEDYSLGSPGKLSMIRLGEIGGVVRSRLFELDIALALVRPSTLKRFATGKGNATKEEMVAAANYLTPPHRLPPANHDEADAFHLRRMGYAAAGHITDLTSYELDALSVVKWTAHRGWSTASAPNPTPSTVR